MDQKGEKILCGVEIGSSVGEVNPPSKSADGAGSWRDSGRKRRGLMATDSRMRNPSVGKVRSRTRRNAGSDVNPREPRLNEF